MTKPNPLVLLGCLALALTASAQDQATSPPAGDAPAPPADAAPPADQAREPGDQAREPAEDEADGDEDELLEERDFIFSEEIPADQQVTFPVDI